MELIYAIAVGVMVTCSVFLLLRGHTFTIVLGLTLLSYAVNLFLFASGGLRLNSAAILNDGGTYADPLPQALVLTAIVIGFAMTAFALILAIRARADLGNDQVDGKAIPGDVLGDKTVSADKRANS
ncbi:Na+/H+ antiporter subunit C [Thalassolituus sp.]|jgi:multicomponent K+:H+ antiporter subunit C|uniref:Na+/H+ antiporter subunit C n=1 Tax=Thalassolituus sp. TaxID=2030822 RepID=UPI002A806B38|nr:Na+/H+ antiporter subunit C [Thalassolituus sp.]|tara:strand:- start:423 stop:800 length:378 start_codon:yes stop_codon:yes gene_type:complete